MSVACPKCGAKTSVTGQGPGDRDTLLHRSHACTNPQCGHSFETAEVSLENISMLRRALYRLNQLTAWAAQPLS